MRKKFQPLTPRTKKFPAAATENKKFPAAAAENKNFPAAAADREKKIEIFQPPPTERKKLKFSSRRLPKSFLAAAAAEKDIGLHL